MLTLAGIKGVGDATIKKLNALDIRSAFELFSFLPTKYISLSDPISVAEAQVGQLALFEGRVERVSPVSKGRAKGFYVSMLDARSNGKLHFRVTFYNMPFMRDSFLEGQSYRLLGRLANDGGVFNIVNPQLEKLEKIDKLKGVYPVYPLKGVIGQNAFKNVMRAGLEELIGANYYGKFGEINNDMVRAFYCAHRPESVEEAEDAVETLASLDLAIALSIYRKLGSASSRKRVRKCDLSGLDTRKFVAALPFEPTKSQLDAFDDIVRDLASYKTMSRIISGDVGSGKTIVAFFAAYAAAYMKKQSAIMVPTELLARQHSSSFEGIANRLGITYATLTASTSQEERRAILDGLKSGEISCVIGTQSLISEGVEYKDLGVAIIDEQHRFGVNERRALEGKGAIDVLSMTATPIPRSMALTFYDDVDISYVKKRSSAVTNVTTELVGSVEAAIEKLVDDAKAGNRSFIVCPAIADAEGNELMSIESFVKEYAHLFDGVRYTVLHGKMKDEDKTAAMNAFRNGELDILIATTVIEIGIDTIARNILILNADRFGLATLHQLRGRVGRDGSPSHCYLFSGSHTQKALQRLTALIRSNDGQYLAEMDFAMRGAGELIGVRQSGASSTPMFGLKLTRSALERAKKYSDEKLSELSLEELYALTRRSEERLRTFIETLQRVTLNS